MVVVCSGQLIALYDAKYKWPDSTPSRADLYQMITYCDRLGLREATLIYPVATPTRTVGVGNKVITVLGLRPTVRAPAFSPDVRFIRGWPGVG
jgi:McrBC 5-methylcytosine restriction system component